VNVFILMDNRGYGIILLEMFFLWSQASQELCIILKYTKLKDKLFLMIAMIMRRLCYSPYQNFIDSVHHNGTCVLLNA
jgi:hypothetical protein